MFCEEVFNMVDLHGTQMRKLQFNMEVRRSKAHATRKRIKEKKVSMAMRAKKTAAYQLVTNWYYSGCV